MNAKPDDTPRFGPTGRTVPPNCHHSAQDWYVKNDRELGCSDCDAANEHSRCEPCVGPGGVRGTFGRRTTAARPLDIVVVPAPGDRCGGSGVLPNDQKCPGCRACS